MGPPRPDHLAPGARRGNRRPAGTDGQKAAAINSRRGRRAAIFDDLRGAKAAIDRDAAGGAPDVLLASVERRADIGAAGRDDLDPAIDACVAGRPAAFDHLRAVNPRDPAGFAPDALPPGIERPRTLTPAGR